jgi:multicomponent K+:H+ antiporter subunit G
VIADLPLWAALLMGLLLLGGALLTLLGAIGLLRAPTFYSRVHPPTLGGTLGMSGILFASMLYFSVTGKRLAVHELLLVITVPVVTPVTMMLLARAAMFRDRRLTRADEEQYQRSVRVAAELARAEAEAELHPGPAEAEPPP